MDFVSCMLGSSIVGANVHLNLLLGNDEITKSKCGQVSVDLSYLGISILSIWVLSECGLLFPPSSFSGLRLGCSIAYWKTFLIDLSTMTQLQVALRDVNALHPERVDPNA
jgi:hypothetical protein